MNNPSSWMPQMKPPPATVSSWNLVQSGPGDTPSTRPARLGIPGQFQMTEVSRPLWTLASEICLWPSREPTRAELGVRRMGV